MALTQMVICNCILCMFEGMSSFFNLQISLLQCVEELGGYNNKPMDLPKGERSYIYITTCMKARLTFLIIN